MMTHMPFWLVGLGSHTVAFNRYKLLLSMYESVDIIFMAGKSKIKMPFQGLVASFDNINDNVITQIVDHINNIGYDVLYCQYDLFLNIALQVNCKKVVEIHDVMHLRQDRFKIFDYVAPFLTTEDLELSRLRQYDSVICLSQEESVYLRNKGIMNVHLIPPNFEINATLDTKGEYLGIIGSSAKPNIDGIIYYQKSLIEIENLVIAGSISNTIDPNIYTNSVNVLGVIPETHNFYKILRGTLVPVRFGAGVKIKTIESLINMVPVFSTSHGVGGLPEGIECVSFVFDELSEWCTSNFNLLKTIKKSDVENYVHTNFSYSECAIKINCAF